MLDHPYGAGASENVPHNRSYTAALAAAAMRGVRGAGHEVDLIDLIETGWRLNSVLDPVAAGCQRRLMEADHLVFAFPVWWESMPAGTKGFLDKALTKGIVYSEPDKPGLVINGIKNIKSFSLITVMSTPSFVYRWILGNPLPKVMFRGTFRKIGVKELRWFSAVDPAGKTLEARQRQLQKTKTQFAQLFS